MGMHTQNVGHMERFPPRSRGKLPRGPRRKLVLSTKSVHTAYRNTTPIQILQHLDTRWCPLDVHAKKNLRLAYHHFRQRQAPILPRANVRVQPLRQKGIKDDFDEAKLYFEGLVRDYEVYVLVPVLAKSPY